MQSCVTARVIPPARYALPGLATVPPCAPALQATNAAASERGGPALAADQPIPGPRLQARKPDITRGADRPCWLRLPRAPAAECRQVATTLLLRKNLGQTHMLLPALTPRREAIL